MAEHLQTAVERNEAVFTALSAKLGRSLPAGLRATPTSGGEGAIVVDDDDDAGKHRPLAASLVVSVLSITAQQAKALLGPDPLTAAREINASRASSGVPSAPVAVSEKDRQGRWLFKDRYSLDQVPCSLVNGDVRTYNAKGDKEAAWVAGSGKGDDGKRFCSLQICIRCANGNPSELYHG